MGNKTIWSIDSIDEREMIRFIRDKAVAETPLHGHEFMEIEYIQNGSIVQTINGKEYLGKKGDFFVLYKGDIHGYVPSEDTEIVNLVFYSELYDETFWQDFCIQDKVRLNHMVHLKKSERDKLATLLDLMEEEFNSKKENYIFILRQFLHIVITLLVRAGKGDNSPFNSHISEIIKYIDENVGNITVSSLAEHFGYSANYFTKIFKKNLGVAPIEYINRRKIIAAIKKLLQTEDSIETIMYDLNFFNKTHFYNLFKRYTGQSPKSIRQTNGNKIINNLE